MVSFLDDILIRFPNREMESPFGSQERDTEHQHFLPWEMGIGVYQAEPHFTVSFSLGRYGPFWGGRGKKGHANGQLCS